VHNEELRHQILYGNEIQEDESAGHVECMGEKKNSYNTLVRKFEGRIIYAS